MEIKLQLLRCYRVYIGVVVGNVGIYYTQPCGGPFSEDWGWLGGGRRVVAR